MSSQIEVEHIASTYMTMVSKEQKIVNIGRYIVKISDIGRYRHDFANRKSIGKKIIQKSVKSPIFRQNIESVPHARVGWNFQKNIGKYRIYINKILEIHR